jgi:hypothetical protein
VELGDDFFLAIDNISSNSIFIPFIAGIIRWKRRNKIYQILYGLILVGVLAEFSSRILINYGYSSMIVFRIYTVLELFFLSWYYYSAIKNGLIRKLIVVLYIIFLIVPIYEFVTDDLILMDSISTTSEAVIVIFYSLFMFYFMLQNIEQDNLSAVPNFWFNSGIIIYFAGAIFGFMFWKYTQSTDMWVNSIISSIHALVNVTYAIFTAIGFWKTRKQSI